MRIDNISSDLNKIHKECIMYSLFFFLQIIEKNTQHKLHVTCLLFLIRATQKVYIAVPTCNNDVRLQPAVWRNHQTISRTRHTTDLEEQKNILHYAHRRTFYLSHITHLRAPPRFSAIVHS